MQRDLPVVLSSASHGQYYFSSIDVWQCWGSAKHTLNWSSLRSKCFCLSFSCPPVSQSRETESLMSVKTEFLVYGKKDKLTLFKLMNSSVFDELSFDSLWNGHTNFLFVLKCFEVITVIDIEILLITCSKENIKMHVSKGIGVKALNFWITVKLTGGKWQYSSLNWPLDFIIFIFLAMQLWLGPLCFFSWFPCPKI